MSISGTPKRRLNTPKRGVVGGNAKVAPEGKLQPARHRVTLDRRDHRLAQHHSRRAHWAVASLRELVEAPAASTFKS